MMRSSVLPSQEGFAFQKLSVEKAGKSSSCYSSSCCSSSKTCSLSWCNAASSSFNGNSFQLDIHKEDGKTSSTHSRNKDEKGVKDVYYMTLHVMCAYFPFENGQILIALLF
jgi:hypothetical protein